MCLFVFKVRGSGGIFFLSCSPTPHLFSTLFLKRHLLIVPDSLFLCFFYPRQLFLRGGTVFFKGAVNRGAVFFEGVALFLCALVR